MRFFFRSTPWLLFTKLVDVSCIEQYYSKLLEFVFFQHSMLQLCAKQHYMRLVTTTCSHSQLEWSAHSFGHTLNHHLSAYITVFFASFFLFFFFLFPNEHDRVFFLLFIIYLFIYLTHCHPIAAHLITVRTYTIFGVSFQCAVEIERLICKQLSYLSFPPLLFSSFKVIKWVFFVFSFTVSTRRRRRTFEYSRGKTFLMPPSSSSFLPDFLHFFYFSLAHSYRTYLSYCVYARLYETFIHFFFILDISFSFFSSVFGVVVLVSLRVIVNKQEHRTYLHVVASFCFGMKFYTKSKTARFCMTVFTLQTILSNWKWIRKSKGKECAFK